MKHQHTLTRKSLKGNWCTLLTPIDAVDRISWTLLADELDILISAAPDGIYSNGTAGEFHNQTEAEFDQIQELLSEKCRASNLSFQIGASHPAPVISLERIRRTASLKPDAFQIILPDWVVATTSEQDRFLSKLAEAAEGIPLVLYNPPHAKSVLSPTQLQRLADRHPELIGLKTAAGDASWYEAMEWSRDCFSVFVPGHFLATGYATGIADGAYSNVACLSPKGAQSWCQLMQTDLSVALELQARIHAFFDESIVPFKEAGYSNPALDKLLAAAGAWCPIGTRLRWPYEGIPEREVSKVGDAARKWLPEFF
jgi:dihydrodipicolinate synthase/N-acetylneuraminate lyase